MERPPYDSPMQKVDQFALGRFDPRPIEDPDGSGRLWYHPNVRTFEAAETNRLNEAHWRDACDRPINDDLADALPTMRVRSNHEATNNPSMEGLILSHTLAVVGRNGPSLDVQTDDEEGEAWAAEAEQVWQEWADQSDATGQLQLGARLKQWNRSGWTCGEWIDQLVDHPRVPGPIKLRLMAIPPQRLCQPFQWYGDPRKVLGVHRDEFGGPIGYWIADEWGGVIGGGQELPQRDVLHVYNKLETDQARGIPWMQTGLPTAADLRDYDVQVMDAARAAADMALVAFTRHPDSDYVETNESVAIKRRRIQHMAPGWELGQIQPHQPSAQYKEHRHERMGDLGRGQGVPSMVVRLDARDHNYSSARFDYSLLHESAEHCRSNLYEPALLRLVRVVLREAELAGAIRRPPRRWKAVWTWPSMPQIDELKSAEAERIALRNGTMTYSEAVARRGRRAADVIRQNERDDAMLLAHGQQPISRDVGVKRDASSNDASNSNED